MGKDVIAICTPALGRYSETFIKRHIEDLSSRAVVISDRLQFYGNAWQIRKPTLRCWNLPRFYRGIFNSGGYNQIRLHIPQIFHKKRIRLFWQHYQVKVVLAEFLDYAMIWLPIARELNIDFFAHALGYDVSLCLQHQFWRKKYLQLNQATGVIVVSKYSKQKLMDIGIREEKIHIIPWGVNFQREIATCPQPRTIKCLAVGRLTPKKGPLYTLAAFARALQQIPNMELHYIGHGELMSKARQFVDSHQLHRKVFLYGYQAHAVVTDLLRQCQIFLQHSLTPNTCDQEGLPVAILEAMAAGMAVVSTYHAGIPEAITHGVSGLLVAEGDIEAMAENIVNCAGDAALRYKLGENARKIVKSKYTWQHERQKLREILGLQ